MELLPPLRRLVRSEGELSVSEAIAQLDAAAQNKEANFDPNLRHYLQKRSYVKALGFLEEGQTCGHHG